MEQIVRIFKNECRHSVGKKVLLALLGLTLHKSLQNTKRRYVCSYNEPIETLKLCNSIEVNEYKTKNVQGQGPSNKNQLPVWLSLPCLQGFLSVPSITFVAGR